MKKLLILLALTALGAGGFGFWYLNNGNSSNGSFRTEPATRGDLLATIGATGTVQPEEVVDVGAQVGGKVMEFGTEPVTGKRIDYGSHVEEGTVLAQIDDALYKARVKQSKAKVAQAERKAEQAQAKVAQADANVLRAEADLRQARTKDRQAERDWERLQRIRSSAAVSPQELDASLSLHETAQAAVGVAEAALVQAKAALKDAQAAVGDAKAFVDDARAALEGEELNLRYTTIRSPIKGIIISRRVTLGQTVQSSFNAPSLFLLARDLKRVLVWVSVNEADLGQVHVGQKVRFTVDAYPGESFPGTVNRIRLDATLNQNVVTYTVEVLTDNSSGRLQPYQTANVQLARRRGGVAVLARPAGGAAQPQARLRLPELQPAAADQRPGKRDDAAVLCARPLRARGARAGGGAAAARRTGRPHAPPPVAAVRRAAAARRHRPGPDQQPGAAVRRRADRQPRLAHQRGDPADIRTAQRGEGHHDRAGDARRRHRPPRAARHPHARRADRERPVRRGERRGVCPPVRAHRRADAAPLAKRDP